MYSNKKYRDLADIIGGEGGQLIHELLDRSENDKLLGSQEVAFMLGIDPKNMYHKRKTKHFPEPDVFAGKFPFWFESKIKYYLDHIDEWRDQM